MRPPTEGPHFFATPTGAEAWLEGEDAHHLARVLRAGAGDPVSLADGSGAVYQAQVSQVEPRRVRLEVTARWEVPLPRPTVTVVQALPKGRKLDEVVQRLSEIGVDRLVPVHSARSETRLDPARAAKAVTRWRAVALAAGKQSRRARLLEVSDVGEWQPSLERAAGVVLWEEATEPLASILGGLLAADELVLGIGPEGGLTAGEVAASGLPAASLGATVLRTETAPVVAAAIVLHRLGRLG